MTAPASAGSPRAREVVRHGPFTVLVPVGLPASGPALLSLARMLVPEGREMDIRPLHVAAGPRPEPSDPPDAVLAPMLEAAAGGVMRVEPIVRTAPDVAAAIVAAAEESAAELVVLGWQRPTLNRRLIGGTVASVMAATPAEVVVLYDRQPRPWRRLLVPYLFGRHDRAAVGVAQRLAHESETVTILHVVEMDEDPRSVGPLRESMHEGRSEVKVVPAGDPLEAVIREARSGDYDAIVVGTSRSWGMGPNFLGVRHELLARATNASMLIVRAASE